MTTPDFRALCEELLAAADEYAGMNPYMKLDNAMKAARTALAATTPEAAPVATDEDLWSLWANRPNLPNSSAAALRACYNLGRQHGAAQPPAAQPEPPVAPKEKSALAQQAYVAFVQICKGNSDDAGTYAEDEELVRQALKRLDDLEQVAAQPEVSG